MCCVNPPSIGTGAVFMNGGGSEECPQAPDLHSVTIRSLHLLGPFGLAIDGHPLRLRSLKARHC